MLDGAFHEVQAELLGFGEGRFDIRRIQREVVDGAVFHRRGVHGPHLEGQVVQAQEGAAVLTVGIDAEAFEAETLVVGDGAFEVRGRNADMLDAGDGVANGHGDSSEQDGFAGIERQSHRENGVGVDYLPISAR